MIFQYDFTPILSAKPHSVVLIEKTLKTGVIRCDHLIYGGSRMDFGFIAIFADRFQPHAGRVTSLVLVTDLGITTIFGMEKATLRIILYKYLYRNVLCLTFFPLSLRIERDDPARK